MALLVPVLGIEEVRAHRGWFLFMGVALIILGTIAIGSAEVMTMVSVMLIGWLLLFGGLFEIVHGFARRAWGGFFVNLMGGLLYAVTGLLMVTHPGVAAVTLTFMIAMLLIVAGTFRIFVAFSTPIPSSRMAGPERRHFAVPRILDHELVAGFRTVGHRTVHRHRHDLRRLD